jgi:outer membrane lipoprotein-sorting protein
MVRKTKVTCLFLVACVSCALISVASNAAAQAVPTVGQIIEKNIAARGGMKAWHDIQTMTMTGKLDAGSKLDVQLPFVMKLKRSRMSRLELDVAGKTAIQVYDGTNGWKVRPFLGRLEVEPFTQAEMESVAEQQLLDGYLINHEAKGINVDLLGSEPVEGRDAYKLRLTMKNGDARNLWVDAQSFLEVKMEGTPRKLDRKMHNVEVYYRDYKKVSGLMIPFVIETVVEKVQPSRKMKIDTVALNPKFDDDAFAKPRLSGFPTVMSMGQNVTSVQTKAGGAR